MKNFRKMFKHLAAWRRAPGGGDVELIDEMDVRAHNGAHRLLNGAPHEPWRPEGAQLRSTLEIIPSLDYQTEACIHRVDRREWHPPLQGFNRYGACIHGISILSSSDTTFHAIVREIPTRDAWERCYLMPMNLMRGMNHFFYCNFMDIGIYNAAVFMQVEWGPERYKNMLNDHYGPSIFMVPDSREKFVTLGADRNGLMWPLDPNILRTLSYETRPSISEEGDFPFSFNSPLMSCYSPDPEQPFPRWMRDFLQNTGNVRAVTPVMYNHIRYMPKTRNGVPIYNYQTSWVGLNRTRLREYRGDYGQINLWAL